MITLDDDGSSAGGAGSVGERGSTRTACSARARLWWTRELEMLRRSRPRVHAVLLHAWSRPLPALPLLAFVVLGAVGAAEPDGDARWFRTASVAMIGPGFWDVFADGGLQIGPLYLLALGVVTRTVLMLGLPVLFTLAGLQAAAVVWLALVVARRLADEHGIDPRPAQWALGLVLSVGGLLADATLAGHPEEIFIALLLVSAGMAARRPSGSSVGLWLALATVTKAWGALGAPILLMGRPRPRELVRRVAGFGVVTALSYGSFMVFGTVSTFEFEWTATAWSPLSTLVVRWGLEGWWLRLAQGAIVGLVGWLVASRRWVSPVALVLVIVATRLVLDPLNLTYYKGPVLVLVLLWVWTSPVARRGSERAVATVAAPVLGLLPFVSDSDVVPVVWFVVLLVVPAWAVFRERSGSAQLENLVVDLTKI